MTYEEYYKIEEDKTKKQLRFLCQLLREKDFKQDRKGGGKGFLAMKKDNIRITACRKIDIEVDGRCKKMSSYDFPFPSNGEIQNFITENEKLLDKNKN